MSTNCEAVYNFLSEEGFRPQIDKEGDIVFKAEGDTYLICFNESDDDFMAVRKYIRLDPGLDISVYKLAHDIASDYKVGKCMLLGDDELTLLLTVETLEDMTSFRKNFERYLIILKEMEEDFAEGYDKLNS